MDAERQPGGRGRGGDGREIVERERDVLHVDIDLIGEPLGRCCGDQLLARGPDPIGARHALRHRVAREQRHRTRLRRGVRERARQPRLPELGLHGQPVPGLQLQRGRSVRGHLTDERHAERQHVVVGGGREHPAAAEDASLLAVQVAVARAGQARLELVGAPAEERQVHVAVDEPGNEQAAVGGADRGRPRQAACGSDVRRGSRPPTPRRRARPARSRSPPRLGRGAVPRPSRARRRPPPHVYPSCGKPSGRRAADRDPTVRPYTRCMHVEREIVLPTTPGQAWGVLVDWERQADWMLDADRVDVISEHREGRGRAAGRQDAPVRRSRRSRSRWR